MKRIVALLLTLLTFALCIPTLCADVDWEPVTNFFYEAHQSECEPLQKSYRILEGTPLYLSPTDAKPYTTTAEDMLYHILAVYTDAENRRWGYEKYYGKWVEMTRVLPILTNEDFLRVHESALQPYNGELNIPYQVDALVYLWPYPGSRYYDSPVACWDERMASRATHTYTDSNGDLWVCLTASPDEHSDNAWIYLPDPYRAEPIALVEMPFPTPEPPQPTPASKPLFTPEVQDDKLFVLLHDTPRTNTLLTALLVCGVVLVAATSAALIAVLYRRKKR